VKLPIPGKLYKSDRILLAGLDSMINNMLKGRAFKFGDMISTDHIIPGRYANLRSNLPELAKHVMEDADPTFAGRVKQGDFIVGGINFGMGSSREHAPLVIKMAGVKAIIAKSVARIFFRNAINLGLPILICNTDKISDGDELEVDLKNGEITDVTNNNEITFSPIPDEMLQILEEGGLLPFIKKYGGFNQK
jgi:3-isopropylmalate/(R)-2-methylmalate dehydratase small subunit